LAGSQPEGLTLAQGLLADQIDIQDTLKWLQSLLHFTGASAVRDDLFLIEKLVAILGEEPNPLPPQEGQHERRNFLVFVITKITISNLNQIFEECNKCVLKFLKHDYKTKTSTVLTLY